MPKTSLTDFTLIEQTPVEHLFFMWEIRIFATIYLFGRHLSPPFTDKTLFNHLPLRGILDPPHGH